MKDNNTTPAMKEVETVEQAAKLYCDRFTSNITNLTVQSFIAGAQWREENPVKGEVKSVDKICENCTESHIPVVDAIEGYKNNEWDIQQTMDSVYAAMEAYHAQFLPPTPKQDKEIYLTQENVEKLGFKPIPHFTVMNSLTYDLGRDRHLSIGCIGTPNEMLWLCNVEDKKTTDLVCLHNFDYDGKLTVSRLQQFINAFNNPNTKRNN